MPSTIFGEKRTRSQLTLPDALLHGISERSPLKDAKSALRRNGLLGATSPRDTQIEPSSETDEEDELLLSPRRPATPPRSIKRSASPPPVDVDPTPITPSRGRESKRPKLAPEDGPVVAEDDGSRKSVLKPVRSHSVPQSSSRSLINQGGIMQNSSNGLPDASEQSPSKRARSLPLFTASPYIDLRRPPITPLRPRSPSKPAPPQVNLETATPNSKPDNSLNHNLSSSMHVDEELPLEQTPKQPNNNPTDNLTTPKPAPATLNPPNKMQSTFNTSKLTGISEIPPVTPANGRPVAIFSNSPLTPVPPTPLYPKKNIVKLQPSKLGSIAESRPKSSLLSQLAEKDSLNDSSESSEASTSRSEIGRTSVRTHEKSTMGPPPIPAKKIVPSRSSASSGDLNGKRNANTFLMENASKKPKTELTAKAKEKVATAKIATILPKGKKPLLAEVVARNQPIASSSRTLPASLSFKGKEKATEESPKPVTLKSKMKGRFAIKPRPVPLKPQPITSNSPPSENGMAEPEGTSLPTTVSETSTLVDLTEIPHRNSPILDKKGEEQDQRPSVDEEPEDPDLWGGLPESPSHRPLDRPETSNPATPPPLSLPPTDPLEPNDQVEAEVSQIPGIESSIPDSASERSEVVLQSSAPDALMESAQSPTDVSMNDNPTETSHDDDNDSLFGDSEIIPSSQEEPMDVTPTTPEISKEPLPEPVTAPEIAADEGTTDVATEVETADAMVVDEPAKPSNQTIVESKSKSSIPRPKAKPLVAKRVPAAIPRTTRVTRSKKTDEPSTSSKADSLTIPKTPHKQKSFSEISATMDAVGAEALEATLSTSSLSSVPSEPKSAPASPVKASSSVRKPGESSYARPTFSAISKQNPLGPVSKPAGSPNKLVRSASMHTTRPTGLLRTLTGVAGPPSSLSTLENALEKLQMPAPERPNTSLGFNRDNDDDTDSEAPPAKKGGIFPSASRSSIKPHSTTGIVRPNGAAGVPKIPGIFGTKGTIMRSTGGIGNSTRGGTAKQGLLGGPFVGMSRARLTQKASKKSSLPMVVGSPVKGGGSMDMDVDMDLTVDDLLPAASGSGGSANTDASLAGDKGKEESEAENPKSRLFGHSRRVSLISQALSQSLNDPFVSKPHVALGSMGPPATPPGKGKARAQSEGVNTPSSDAGSSESTSPGRKTSTRNLRSANKPPEKNPPAQASTSKKNAPSANESDKILKDCIIFVDVRTDEGEDAGSLFVEMLENVGARILTRVGQTCTHIVFKNGLMSTLNRYRLLRDPKPHVVGIAWVVDCIEKKQKVDEAKFLVDVEGMNVAGINKRRRSMLPKFLSRGFDDDTSPASMDREHDADVDTSLDRSTSSITGDGLTPLERARMRKAV